MDKIIIHGGCEIREDMIVKVKESAPGFLAAVRQEDGLVSYDLSWDILDTAVLRLLEHWESEAAYAVHRTQPHVQEWAEMMKTVSVVPIKSNKSRATAL